MLAIVKGGGGSCAKNVVKMPLWLHVWNEYFPDGAVCSFDLPHHRSDMIKQYVR